MGAPKERDFPIWLMNVAVDSETVRNFIAEGHECAQGSANDRKEIERVRLLAKFVHDRIKYDVKEATNYDLESVIISGRGVCVHKGALLQLILTEEGYDVKGVSGKILLGCLFANRHQWLCLNIGDEKYMVDPTNMHIDRYEKFSIKQLIEPVLTVNPERQGSFKMLRTEMGYVQYTYENYWDWCADGLVHTPMVNEASEQVRPLYENFFRNVEEFKLALENGDKQEIDSKEVEFASAYIEWVSHSNKMLRGSYLE